MARFKAHLLELARYVVLNPVRAEIVRSAKDWRWSSYRATAGMEPPPPLLTADWILSQLDPSPKKAHSAYRKFVSTGRGVPVWESLRGQIYFGSDAFIAQHVPEGSAEFREIPRTQRLADRPALDAVVAGPDDAAGATAAYRDHGYTLKEIASHLGVHYPTISRRLRQHEIESREPR